MAGELGFALKLAVYKRSDAFPDFFQVTVTQLQLSVRYAAPGEAFTLFVFFLAAASLSDGDAKTPYS